uniref:Uncharacterized protein n=1 Tax=Anopheles epiroticus TaxID=199890 RepID=A0A182P5H6_9DIPT
MSAECSDSNSDRKLLLYRDLFCRICLQYSKGALIPIDAEIKKTTLLDMFIQLTTFEIDHNDAYPRFMCEQCVSKLTLAYSIREEFISQTDLLLKLVAQKQIIKYYEQFPLDENASVPAPKTQPSEYAPFRDVKPPKAAKPKGSSITAVRPENLVIPENEKHESMEVLEEAEDLVREEYLNETSLPSQNVSSLTDFSKDWESSSTTTSLDEDDWSYSLNPITPQKLEELKPVKPVRKKYPSSTRKRVKAEAGNQEKKQRKNQYSTTTCYICDTQHETIAERDDHFRHHIHMLPYECTECVADPTPEDSPTKEESQPADTTTTAPTTKHIVLRSVIQLNSHMMMHGFPHKCEHCYRRFTTTYLLNHHLWNYHQHSKEGLTCEWCGKRYYSRRPFQEHVRRHRHSVTERFKCVTCGRAFGSNALLRRHEMVHTGERSHKCTYCSRMFSRRCNLLDHLRLHTGERCHKCNECPQSFNSKASLEKHQRNYHSDLAVVPPRGDRNIYTLQADGTRLYRCKHEGCTFTSVSSTTMTQHRLRHNKPCVCEECGQRFVAPKYSYATPPQTTVLQRFCRLCLREHPFLLPFNATLEDTTLADMLERLLGSFKLKQTPNLPNGVCSHCVTKLNYAYQVQKELVRNEQRLRHYHRGGNVLERLFEYQTKITATKEGRVVNRMVAQHGDGLLTETISVEASVDAPDMREEDTRAAAIAKTLVPTGGWAVIACDCPAKPVAVTRRPVKPVRAVKRTLRSRRVLRQAIDAGNPTALNASPIDPCKCYICNTVLESEASCRTHLAMHVDMLPHICPDCGTPDEEGATNRPITSLAMLQRHYRTHSYPLKCPHCPQRFLKYTSVYSHVRYRHELFDSPEGFTCDVCGVTMQYRPSFMYHMRIHYHEQMGTFRCQYCDRVFGTRARLERHERAHTGERPFACHQCPKTFAHRGQLATHTARHNNERGHQCAQCGKAFFNKAMLRQHLASHETLETRKTSSVAKVRQRPCSYAGCTHVAHTYQAYYMHRLRHEMAHRCDECGRRFAQHGTLTEGEDDEGDEQKIVLMNAEDPIMDVILEESAPQGILINEDIELDGTYEEEIETVEESIVVEQPIVSIGIDEVTKQEYIIDMEKVDTRRPSLCISATSSAEATSGDFCRICLLKRPHLTSLMERIDGVMIPEMLYKLCGRQIEVQDNYPRSICQRCLCQLDCAYKFLNEFHQQDERLRSFYWSGSVVKRLQEYQPEGAKTVEKRMAELVSRNTALFTPPAKEMCHKQTNTKRHPKLVDVGTVTDKVLEVDMSLIKTESADEDILLEQYVMEDENEDRYLDYTDDQDSSSVNEQHLVSMKIDVLRGLDATEPHSSEMKTRRKKEKQEPVSQRTPRQREAKSRHALMQKVKQPSLPSTPSETDDQGTEEDFKELFEDSDAADAKEEEEEEEEEEKYADEVQEDNDEGQEIEPLDPLRCYICEQTEETEAMLEQHLDMHSLMLPFECKSCKVEGAPAPLDEHKVEKHLRGAELEAFLARKEKQRTVKRPASLKDKECPYPDCDYVANTYGAMYVHKRTKHQPVHRCDMCNKSFAFLNQLNMHMKLHTGEKPFQCEICGRSFRRSFSYREHMEMHVTDATYNCPTCNKSFKRPRYLQAHMLTHSTVRKFACLICGNAYKTNGELKKHNKNKHGLDVVEEEEEVRELIIDSEDQSFIVEYV